MKKVRKSMSVILMLLIALFSFSTVAFASTTEQDGLKVELKTDKENYSLNEDIKINVTVSNTNDVAVEHVKIDTLLPEGFTLKDKGKSTSSEAVSIPAGEKIKFSVVAVVKDSNTETSSQDNSKVQSPVDKNNSGNGTDNNGTTNTNKGNDKSPYTGGDYAVMTGLGALFVIGIILLILCLKRYRKKTTKVISSVLCVVLAVSSLVGLFDFKASAENSQEETNIAITDTSETNSISVSEPIVVDNKDYTISVNVSYKKVIILDNNEVSDRSVYVPDEENIVTDEELGISYVDNMIIIVFDENASSSDIYNVIKSINGTVVGKIQLINQYQVQIKECSLDELERIVYDVEQNDCVLFAHYDQAYKNLECSVAPNDPWAGDVDTMDWEDADVDGSNWWLEAIEAPSAWDYNNKFSRIKVGIVDNGFDTGHEDLSVTFPENFGRLNNKEDHGTHVAGIIGATPDNGKGITGVVWNSELICFDYQATWLQDVLYDWSTDTMVYAGFIFNVEAGAKVINFSLGMAGDYPNGITYPQSIIDDEGKTASGYMATLLKKYDFVVVQSAGNGGVDAENAGMFCSITSSNCVDWGRGRAAKQNILNRLLIVAAVQQSENGYMISEFSDSGLQVNICAPGGDGSKKNDRDIYSTVTGGLHGKYKAMPGTSMAAPIVTGVASLVWSVNNNFNGSEVVDIVCSSTNVIAVDNPTSTRTFGNHPMVNAKLSVEEAIRRTDVKGTISGRLKEQGTNSPISNREVKIYNENYTSDNAMYTFVDKTKTDSNGSFKISLPVGTYTLVIDNDGDNFDNNYHYDTVEMKVNVEANADTILLDDIILARRETGIEGYVYDNDDLINNGKNTPISDVTVEIYNNTTSDLVGTCKTNENGKYSIAVDKNGSYNLVFKKTGYMNETKDMVFVNGGFSDVTVFMKKDTSSDDNVKFAGGDGTEANPYQVSTPEQLNAVRNNLSANYVQINDIDMSDWGNWEPIGTNDNQFVGNYNGQKYKIINLTINYSENNTSIGLFGYGAKSIITNVNLEEFNINTLDMYDFTGSIVGYGGTLINCSATGNINSKCYSGGGLAGIADVIENCTFNGIMNFLCSSDFTFRKNLNIDILNMTNNYLSGCYGGICGIGNKVSFSKTEGEFNASTTYQSFLGGIAGYSEIIKQCYNNANLKIQTNGNASNCPEAYIGGISGVSKEVSDCYNIGSLVTISQNYAGMVGGITGLGYGNYSNCYNVGALNNNSKYNWYKGGIIGLSPFKTSTVNYCYSNVKALAGNGNVQSKIKNTNSMYLTEEQFKDKSSFENFNFGDIWNMHSNANNGYPYLIVFEK